MSFRILLSAIVVLMLVGVADARPPYAKAMYGAYPDFGKKYGDEAKKSVHCNVCHVKVGAKSVYKKRNNYGFEVKKTLTKKNDTAKIEEAIKKADKAMSETAGKTFGDLIKNLELPGTNKEKT